MAVIVSQGTPPDELRRPWWQKVSNVCETCGCVYVLEAHDTVAFKQDEFQVFPDAVSACPNCGTTVLTRETD